MKKTIGWLLVLIGVGGLVANVVFFVSTQTIPTPLIVNCVVCLVFVLGGWKLAHPQPTGPAPR